jgi:hypothetical protein
MTWTLISTDKHNTYEYHGFGHHGVLVKDIYLTAEGVIFMLIVFVLEKHVHKVVTRWRLWRLRRKNRNKVVPDVPENEEYLKYQDYYTHDEYELILR